MLSKLLRNTSLSQFALRRTYVNTQAEHKGQVIEDVAKAQTYEKQHKEQLKRNQTVSDFSELVRDFLNPKDFFNSLTSHGINFYTGVPDSLLKDFCAFVTDNAKSHIIAVNEGASIGLGIGHYLSSGTPALVYMQNSGLGNAINPLLSLASPDVYSVPLLLLVGWRGEPGKRDEPQHKQQGQVTPGLLASMHIPFTILPDYKEGADQAIATAFSHMKSTNGPYCFLVKRQTFSPYILKNSNNGKKYDMTRESALQSIIDYLGRRDIVVCTTGMLSRELFEYRQQRDEGHEKDFLTVGGMGHASMIALGIARDKPTRKIVCLDGDGACLMHMGTLATIGTSKAKNFNHIIINNGTHDSVGGQPTDAGLSSVNLSNVAKSVGYRNVVKVSTKEELIEATKKLKSLEGPNLIEVQVLGGHRKNLTRPNRTPAQNKRDFMHYVALS
ncbi:hypothetical protein SNEBB_000792 [Seison nebaliae]|nr:hypothetical protein SNEBB_000792 [Seison nebaliae]